MKNIILTTIICAFPTLSIPVQAQKIIEKHIAYTGQSTVSADIQIADSIRIIPWEKNEVFIRASVKVNDNEDNDRYLWKFDNSEKNIRISARFQDNGSWSNNNSCCCMKTEIYCELYIPKSATLSVETINGNLILTNPLTDLRAKTISGFIDMSAPADLRADMRFKTITGTVYTNFGLTAAKPQHAGPTSFSSSLNGGGSPIDLETISGNIYFRKLE